MVRLLVSGVFSTSKNVLVRELVCHVEKTDFTDGPCSLHEPLNHDGFSYICLYSASPTLHTAV